MDFQKIELYKERLFSDKFSATFDFVKENWRTVLRFMVYLILPVCIVQALGMDTIFNEAFLAGINSAAGDNFSESMLFRLIASYGVYIVCLIVGTVLITALVYGLMKVYDERKNRLAGLTMAEFKPTLLHFIKRTIVLGIAMIPIALLIAAVIVGIAALLMLIDPMVMSLMLLPIYFGAIALLLPLSLASPMYLMDDNLSAYGAVAKALRYGFSTWGGLFGILFVVGIIVQVVMTIAMMPYMVVVIIKGVMTTSDVSTSGFVTIGLQALSYVLGIVQAFGMYLSYAVMYVAIGYHYGHVMERYEGVSVERGVNDFESLTDNNKDDSHLFDALNEIDNFDKL